MIADKMLRAGLDAGSLTTMRVDEPIPRLPTPSHHFVKLWVRGSIPTAAAGAILLALGACSQPPPPVTSAPRTPAVCEALRPALPISYSSSRDTPETVKGVRQANARFSAACP